MLISDVRYFKPQIVTAVFHASKLIAEDEEVTKLTLFDSGDAENGKYYCFSVQYKDFRTQRHAPDHLYLKISKKGIEGAKGEVDFYDRIILPMKRRIDPKLLRFPLCYDSYYDETSDQYHLILDDFTKEFSPSKDKVPPTAKHREQIINSLAILHSYWWDHPLLGELAPLVSADEFEKLHENLQNKVADIKRLVGQYLDAKYIKLLEKIASGFPQKHQERLLTGTGLTVVHNNLTPENIVYSPRETFFINPGNWTVGISTDDLAMMIPLHWSSELRRLQEKPLLKRYFDTIIKRGASNYSWEAFDYDYKASLARVTGNLLSQWTMDKHTRGHWRVMEAAMDSFIEMDGMSIYSD